MENNEKEMDEERTEGIFVGDHHWMRNRIDNRFFQSIKKEDAVSVLFFMPLVPVCRGSRAE